MYRANQRGQAILTLVLVVITASLSFWVMKLYQANDMLSNRQLQMDAQLLAAKQTISLQSTQELQYQAEALQMNQTINQLNAKQTELLALTDNLTAEKLRLIKSVEQLQAQSKDLSIATQKIINLEADIRLARQLLAESDLESISAMNTQSQLQQQQAFLDVELEQIKQQQAESNEQLAIQSQTITDLHSALELAKSDLDQERKFNSSLVVNEKLQVNADVNVLLRERERLIATNKQLVMMVSQIKQERADLEERATALERDLLSMSQRLRDANLTYIQIDKELFADTQ